MTEAPPPRPAGSPPPIVERHPRLVRAAAGNDAAARVYCTVLAAMLADDPKDLEFACNQADDAVQRFIKLLDAEVTR